MLWSDAKKEEIKQNIRALLIRFPHITCRRIAEFLGIDKDTALKYLNEVRRENAERLKKEIDKLKKTSIEEELIKMENEFQELIEELWVIINSKKSTRREKISAIKTLIEARRNLFNVKFDAGIFTRKLGELEVKEKLTQEEKELIKKAIEYASGGRDKRENS